MLNLNYQGLADHAGWETIQVKLPNFDWKQMCQSTEISPTRVHFGAGNIFRGFIARLQQSLLDQGMVKGGIIAADTFDYDIIDKMKKEGK